MVASFRVLTGGRAGEVFTPATDSFVAGRHDGADLRFDRQRDVTVSARHAQFRQRDGVWTVRDLGSRNGTTVNGSAILGEVQLVTGDRVALGAGGPEIELVATAPPPESATLRVRAAVRSERKRAMIVAGVALAFAIPVGVALVVSSGRSRTTWEGDRRELERRIDSLISAGRGTSSSLSAQVTGLSSALHDSERELERLRRQLRSTMEAGGDAEELRREVIAATAALQRQQLAASLDFSAIQRRARGAVAMIWVEFPDGRRASGTAFAVRPNGMLLTNRHLVIDAEDSSRPSRIAVRFADSDQAFPAHLTSVSPVWELALLQVENVVGGVPSVSAFNTRPDTLSPGSPVALIGYPLGGEPEKDPTVERRVARPVVSAGLLLRAGSGIVEVQGLGAAGASGSPILDASGNVLAVLYGGRVEHGVQVLLGVPARVAADFLSSSRQ